ncbi:MAG: 2-polyprenyl-6-hydroxyphenyl methylase/3-demethylubiquinone-9 3-methyltransferase [Alphaproteobacteria bacterium]|jgi:2-polyprenyl-6-hydroxyphenyl methylase/3-demethylubiquinone-9 3-methyltransferase
MLRKDIVRPLSDGKRYVDKQEIAKFDALAEEWWKPDGKFKVVHAFNAARVSYLISYFARRNESVGTAAGRMPLSGLRLLDAGCGAGIVSLPLVEAGAEVTGIDASAQSIAVAQREARNRGLDVDFRCATPDELSLHDEKFDAAVCLEVVEHVADLESFIDDLSHLIAPGGHMVLGTLNRTVQSYLKAIVGAEYILGWLPRQTHDWSKFVTPTELKRLLEHRGFRETTRQGLSFDPFRWRWLLSDDDSVNYLIAFEKQMPGTR